MTAARRLPDPAEQPLLRVDDLVGLVPGMKRSALHDAVRRGDLPSIRLGRRVFIPTAALRAAWGFTDPGQSEGPAPTGPIATTTEALGGHDANDPTAATMPARPLRSA